MLLSEHATPASKPSPEEGTGISGAQAERRRGTSHGRPSERRRKTPAQNLPRGTASTAALADVEARVASAVRSVVGSSVAREASLMESGLDSLGAVELR